MSLFTAYEYHKDKDGMSNFFYAQCKNNRMKYWEYITDIGSYDDVLQAVEKAKQRGKELSSTGEPYYVKRFKNMKYRILKVDIETIEV